ncbi:MAG: transcriptional regulator PpsR [Gemmobacter sp.]
MKPVGKSLLNGKPPENIPAELLSEIVAASADITVVLSSARVVHSVMVAPAHPLAGQLDSWVGKPIDDLLTIESRAKLDARLSALRAAGGSLAVELNHADRAVWEFPVRYTLHRIAADDSVLMLGRDLKPFAELQQKLVTAQLALERDHEAQREMDTRYRVLMETTRDAIVMVSMASGRIEDVNSTAAQMLGGSRSELLGSAIAQEFEGRRRGEFLENMANLATADAATPVELQARRSQRRMMVYPTVFRAAGERLLLCRLEPAGALRAVHDQLAEDLTRLFHEGSDAVIFTDGDGTIRMANEAFLNITDASNLAAVRGRSLSEFLARGAVDLRVLLDNAKRVGRMKMYATRVLTAFAGEVPVEVSASYLNDRPNPGLAIVMRDVSRADTLRRPGFASAEDGGRSLAELVGSSTLKDIVAETTDVVEKLCIETAVELTRNNRVAAAEMLGLSRQSLYVKLRKYGLLSKDGE